MNTDTTWQTRSSSSSATEQLGEQLGKKLKGGEVIELVSDLGGGKTTFVHGLARGFGSNDKVASPSFTVSRTYKAPGKEIRHFDFYRLHEPGIVAHELSEFLGDPHIVTVIEWADIVRGVLPDNRLTVVFSRTDEEERNISFHCPKALTYLLKGLA